MTVFEHLEAAERLLGDITNPSGNVGDGAELIPTALAAIGHGLLALTAATHARNAPTVWTDQDSGTVYDLSFEYEDRDGDRWKMSAWLTWPDGRVLPTMSCLDTDGQQSYEDRSILDVIDEFGPITPLPKAGA